MDVRQEVTDRIVEALEAGAPPWRKGWVSGVPCFNAATGRPYRGINQVVLGMQPFADPRYLTYRQADDMGMQVRKGARGVHVVKMIEMDRVRAERVRDDNDVVAGDDQHALIMRSFTVFNASQIDGMSPMPERETNIKPVDAVEAIVFGMQDDVGSRLKISFDANDPSYRPRKDEIRMPPLARFLSVEDMHATLLHELVHSSGHPARLARLHLDSQFGSPEYAREELVAELGSAMTCAEVGLPMSPSTLASHAGYLSSWLDVLRRDKQEIFRAAAMAQKAVDYLAEKALQWQPDGVAARGRRIDLRGDAALQCAAANGELEPARRSL